jgi:hypothetical protein
MVEPLDVIELRVAVDPWAAGTTATILEVVGDSALVEVSDEDGRTLGTAMAPLDAVAAVS